MMITDEDNPKGACVLSSLERKLDSALKATKLSFLGPTNMPTNIDVVVEEATKDHYSSGESMNLILPAIVKPVNCHRFGCLFPNAVAQALAGAADGMTSAFSKGPSLSGAAEGPTSAFSNKGPPASLFSKGPLTTDAKVNYGKKIRDMHSLYDPNTPTDSSNFASRRESHQRTHRDTNRASFQIPGHDTTNYDTPDTNLNDGLVPMYHNDPDRSGGHRDSSYNYGGNHPNKIDYVDDDVSTSCSVSRNRRTSTSSGFMLSVQSGPAPPRRMVNVPFSGLRPCANVTFPKKLYCNEGESNDTQWANLQKVEEKDIPQTRHRNGSTLKDPEKFDTELPCMSVHKFIVLCAMNGIYGDVVLGR